jgi:hypothetical protein
MVGGVQPVVEKYPIGHGSGDVPAVVKFRVVVAILMLKQIDRYERPLPKKTRYPDVNQSGLPIQDEESRESYIHEHALNNRGAKQDG